MLNWLKNKKHPEFWTNYLNEYENAKHRYVIISVESSGTNPYKDVMLSIGAVGIEKNELCIKDSFEIVFLQYIFNHDNGFSNEFIIESKMPKFIESEGIQRLIKYLKNATIIGHRVDIAIEMINVALEKLDCGKLKNQALDLEIMFRKWKEYSDDKRFSIEEIAHALKIPHENSDLSIEKAYTMGLSFLKLKKYLDIH
ncbi:3'-5' exonuclease [Flavobacterium sp.]|uniref:3'-5' exonuclease n=1 Tax=Flavobacterium sp. TaxID=239 RepID=UPI002612F01D|nr:3'-5' exonuclease [Flavobacterium sp.]MDD3004088.1 3'-5' exonuclease [Flavobacterium sp.]